jgi:sulfate transport system ATP-binding protein
MHIEIDRLDKAFGPTTVLHDIDLEIREREFLGLLGPSGSGKTTLLRILAGLESPDRGGIRFNGRDALSLAPKERRVGFVFQHYALFGHMTVFGNVAFGLHVRPRHDRPARREIADRVNRLLALVQLEGLGDRFPAQLSGGQRQRVALARTLAIEPRVLLLDEPFGALDAKVRIELRRWLREVHETTGLTTVFVTHDQDEALDLADRVAVMNRGRIEQVGTPTEIYELPATPFVYDFLGRSNAFDCVVENGMARIGDWFLPVGTRAGDGPAVAFVRPHDVVLARPDASDPSDDTTLPGFGTVRFLSVLGPRAWVELAYGNRLIEAEIDRRQVEELGLTVGRRYTIRLRLPFVFVTPHQDSVGTTLTAPS